jgi:two-component system, NtrC family, response regulator AtoC
MKTRPDVVVISCRQTLIEEISRGLSGEFQVIAHSTADVMLESSPGIDPEIIIADARDVEDGGHALDRFLEASLQRPTNRLTLVITGDDCPEILQRRIACCGLVQLNAPDDAEPIIERVRATLANHIHLAGPTRVEGAGDADAEVVLRGVTRKFETNSPQLKSMLEDLALAAEHDVTILLIGETGSGKTFLSRLIHEASPRRNEPFLHVACGALPRDLIETELFGHAKGSFTSAHADKEGKFVAAGRGTILLDEIDVLGLEQQVKLLKVIETGEFEPVGSNQTIRSQARLVVASNLDLQPLVEQGRFRPDLYYRLNMLKFEIPPLRRRRMDIVPLARQFIRTFQDRHNIPITQIDDSLLEALVDYPWPGNVRELENVIQRAVIYCRDGRLTARQLPVHIVAGAAGPTNDPEVRLSGVVSTPLSSLSDQVAMTEKEIIEQALLQNNFSKTRTAQSLGISRVTLYNKLKKYDVGRHG